MSDPAPDQSRSSAARSPRAIILFLALFMVALAADLGLKAWSFRHVPDHGITLVPRVLSLRLTRNEGAIFGAMQGQKWFFVAASIAAAGLIVYFFGQSGRREYATHAALSLILAGAMGNLHDRLVEGSVRDMLMLFPDVHLPWGLRWPGGASELYPWIFNLADVFLLVGISLILLRSIFERPIQRPPSEG